MYISLMKILLLAVIVLITRVSSAHERLKRICKEKRKKLRVMKEAKKGKSEKKILDS